MDSPMVDGKMVSALFHTGFLKQWQVIKSKCIHMVSIASPHRWVIFAHSRGNSELHKIPIESVQYFVVHPTCWVVSPVD